MDKIIKLVPSQMKSTSQKTEKWAKDTIDAYKDLSGFDVDRIRKDKYRKLLNFEEFNGNLDKGNMSRVLNPMGLKGVVPANIQNHPIEINKFNVLQGEEALRNFDWVVKTINADAVSQKMQEKKDLTLKLMFQLIQDSGMSEDAIAKRLEQHQKYINYEYRDFKELTATRTLQYLERKLNLKSLTNEQFLNILLSGEELYATDIVAGSPIARSVNPLDLTTLGTSEFVDEKDVVIEETYMSPNEIIDTFYEELKPSQIKKLEDVVESFNTERSYYNGDGIVTIDNDQNVFTGAISESGIFDITTEDVFAHDGENMDEYGNIKVTRVVWKSMRKVLLLHYNNEQGIEMMRYVDETYPINERNGEWSEVKWISEYWEGTSILDFHIKVKPREVQYREMENISKCRNGYVGTISTINNLETVSMYDRIRPIKYLYNIFMARTELAFAKNKGMIGELNLSTIPDGWDTDMWLYYADYLGWAVTDPFTQQKKGAAQGKLAGSMNQYGMRTMNMQMGNFINQHISMLEFLKQELSDITGVTRQREGDVSKSETVGGVERAISSSNHVTAPIFYKHDETKKRLYWTVLETAKVAWSTRDNDEPIPLDFISDGLERVMFMVDPKILNDADYGIFISNSAEDTRLYQEMKQAAMLAAQSGHIKISELAKIGSTHSIREIIKMLEEGEDKAEKAQAEQAKMVEQEKQRSLEIQQGIDAQNHEYDMIKQREKLLADRENILLTMQKDISLKEMDINTKVLDINSKENIQLNNLKEMAKKYENEYKLAKKELDEEIRSNKADEEIKKKATKKAIQTR